MPKRAAMRSSLEPEDMAGPGRDGAEAATMVVFVRLVDGLVESLPG